MMEYFANLHVASQLCIISFVGFFTLFIMVVVFLCLIGHAITEEDKKARNEFRDELKARVERNRIDL